MLLGLFVGGSQLPAASVAWTLLHPHASGDVATIVWQLRAPRVCIAALVGAALAVSGFLLQGMLRNPLVDPFLTGISSGAALATALAIAAGLAIPFVPALGFGAGLLTALAVAFLARRGSGLDAERLILAGISLSALFSAFVALALTRVGRASSSTILAWLAGSIAGRGWNDLFWAAPYAIVGFGLALAVVPALNAMRLGDDVARAVGLDVVRANWMILSAATLLTAAAVALASSCRTWRAACSGPTDAKRCWPAPCSEPRWCRLPMPLAERFGRPRKSRSVFCSRSSACRHSSTST
jgi:iron complex transport system permease protein